MSNQKEEILKALASQMPTPDSSTDSVLVLMGLRNPKAPKTFSINEKITSHDYDGKVILEWDGTDWKNFKIKTFSIIANDQVYYAKAVYLNGKKVVNEFTLKGVPKVENLGIIVKKFTKNRFSL